MITIDLPNYDYWKLQSPYDDPQKPVEHCANCNYPLFEGEQVLFDCGESYFCDKECAKQYIIEHIEELTDFIIDELLTKTEL